MNFRKTLIISTLTIGLVSAVALAHPSKSDADKLAGEAKSKTVKIIDLEGTPFKGRIKIEDFDFDFSELSGEWMEGISSVEGLEGLAKLKALTGMDIKTLTGEDGETTIIIKNNKSGILSDMFTDMEFDFDEHKKHAKHKKKLKKFKKHIKHLKAKQHAEHKQHSKQSSLVIKRLLNKLSDDDDNVRVWVQKNGDEGFDKGDDVTVFMDGGDIKIIKNGQDISSLSQDGRSVNIDKTTHTKNGKRTTRIVIEIEEMDD